MRRSMVLFLAAWLTAAGSIAGADDSGESQQRPPPRRQRPYPNYNNGGYGNGGYGYNQQGPLPYGQGAYMNQNVMLQNQSYAFGGGGQVFLAPGRGLPGTFRAVFCYVRLLPQNLAEVIAQDPYRGFWRIWVGPGGSTLIAAVNAIKMQTGMCDNLPLLPVPPPMPLCPGAGACGGGYNPGFPMPINPGGPGPGAGFGPGGVPPMQPPIANPYGGGAIARPPGT